MKFEIVGIEAGQMSPAIINLTAANDSYFELGLQYAAGRNVPRDLVAAHKWFNVSALKGNREAMSYRKEVAQEMSADEVAIALLDAREFLTVH